MWPQDQLHRAPVNDFPPIWASSWGDDEYGLWADLTITSNGITATQKMRWIEPSQERGFLMGSTREERNRIKNKSIKELANLNESDRFLVQIKKGFWLANTPCTQGFWTAVVGNSPSHFQSTNQALNLPVENISFQDNKNKNSNLINFLELLNSNLKDIILNGLNNALVIKATLPTEAEWEYACRADTTTAFWWGDYFDSTKANINYSAVENFIDVVGSSNVNLYPPNPWGLYDMHGNVWEWTLSSPAGNFPYNKAKNDVVFRVLRGGSWEFLPDVARSAYRSIRHISDRLMPHGFRFLIRSSN